MESILTISLQVGMSGREFNFPPGFLFGVASSSYQTEGAWNVDGKGESIWDRLCHERSDVISNGESGDVACDSYHRYKEDVQCVKELGVDFYRFSISWPRILPTGMAHIVNQAGVNFYSNFIDELLANGIQPVVTMYHWDLPQPLQEMGGWTNPEIIDIFQDYARVLFSNYGDRVKIWTTFNEPLNICLSMSECEIGAPLLKLREQGTYYLIIGNVLKAHANVYHMYNDEFRPRQKGKIGLTTDTAWFYPATESAEDVKSAELAQQFRLGVMLHPIFSAEGDYPRVIKELCERVSKEKGLRRCCLPQLTDEWVKKIKGSADFLGLNIYFAFLTNFGDSAFFLRDTGINISIDPAWPSTCLPYYKVVPSSLRKTLQWIKIQYDNPPVMVTESGMADDGQLYDQPRVDYIKNYLREALKAIHLDNCNVIGFTIWCLMDNFEWLGGYSAKFGLYHVDFNDRERPRTAKESARQVAIIARRRMLSADK